MDHKSKYVKKEIRIIYIIVMYSRFVTGNNLSLGGPQKGRGTVSGLLAKSRRGSSLSNDFLFALANFLVLT